MRPFNVPHAMGLRGKKKSFDIGATRLFDGYAFLRLVGIISFFGRRLDAHLVGNKVPGFVIIMVTLE